MKYNELPTEIIEYFIECFEYCDHEYTATARYCSVPAKILKNILDYRCETKMNFRSKAKILNSYIKNV